MLGYCLLILRELPRCDPEASLRSLEFVLFDGDCAGRGIISGPVERMNSAISLVVSFLARASRGSILVCLPLADVDPPPDIRPLSDVDGTRDLPVSGREVGAGLDNGPCRFGLAVRGLERRPFTPFTGRADRPVTGRAPGFRFIGSSIR